jgi:hypothetical protein
VPCKLGRFAHLLRGKGSLVNRMWEFVDRDTYCPIVYNWMEAVKDLTKFRRSVLRAGLADMREGSHRIQRGRLG